MSRIIVFAIALTALAGTAAAAEQWSKSYSVGTSAALSLVVDDASVHVSGWSEPRVRIDVEAVGWKFGPGGLRISEAQTGDHVDFRLREPVLQFHFGLTPRWVRIEVHVPERTTLDVKTGDGNLWCEQIQGPARLDTGDGNIAVSALAGDIHLHSGDGRIDARELDGALTATTGDGRVRIHGRFDALNLSTRDGGLTVDVAPGSQVRLGWRIHTGDGPVVLRLPSDLRATLDAKTGDGGLSVDVPVKITGPIRDNLLRGTLNGGGPEFEVHTGDGPIVIEPFVAAAEFSPGAGWDDRDSARRHRTRSIKHGR